MANNRMWLRNVRTGEQILLAKYYPSTGWFVAPTFREELVQSFLDDNEPDTASKWGSNEYGVLYEQGEPNEGETVRDPVTMRWRAKQ